MNAINWVLVIAQLVGRKTTIEDIQGIIADLRGQAVMSRCKR
jgi:hypothetical protein